MSLINRFLDPSAPYVHFWAGGTRKKTSCEGMLFVGIEENGDGNEDLRRREQDVVDLFLQDEEED